MFYYYFFFCLYFKNYFSSNLLPDWRFKILSRVQSELKYLSRISGSNRIYGCLKPFPTWKEGAPPFMRILRILFLYFHIKTLLRVQDSNLWFPFGKLRLISFLVIYLYQVETDEIDLTSQTRYLSFIVNVYIKYLHLPFPFHLFIQI